MIETADAPRVAVLVLAAGSGRRLGLGPKAHVDLGGVTFLARIASACRDAGLEPLVVVGSAEDPLIAAACTGASGRLVVNVDPSRGMSSSVHAGLDALAGGVAPDAVAGVLVFPVDLPLVRAGTLGKVARAVALRPDAWARPTFEGHAGHPVALGAAVYPRVLGAGPTVPLRDALRLIDAPAVDVPCDDPGIFADIDTPEDLAAARATLL